MNKVFLGLILAVCVLGMALVMLNDRLGRKAEPRPAAPVAENISNEEMAINARAMELAEAAKALAPPKHEPSSPAAASFTAPASPAVVPVPAPQPPMPAIPPQKADRAEVQAPKPAPVKVEQSAPPAVAKPEPPAQKPAPVKADKPAEQAKPEPPKAETPKPAPPRQDSKAAEAPRADAPKAETAKSAAGGKTANRFVVYARDKGATVRVGGNGKMEYSSMTLENPNRIVVDFSGDWKFPANLGIPKNELVNAVRVAQNGDKTRMVIDLKDKPRKVLLVPFKGGDGVDVRVDK